MTTQFYRAFEDRYRGSREVIKSRLRTYQPFLGALLARYPGAPALDLGCGRGEWLELLTEQGFRARGIDLDAGMLAACLERGLDASHADALAALSALPDASMAMVSAFHLVEHIPFETVRALVAEALRVLMPGGLLILETPNPENIVVGSSDFYTDPSHLRPIPPNLLAFAAEHGGFARHVLMRLQEDPQLHEDPPLGLLTVLEGASPDYSVVAQKDAAPELLGGFDVLFGASYGLDMKTLALRYQAQAAHHHAEIHHALGNLAERISADRASGAADHAALSAQQQAALDALRSEQQSVQESLRTEQQAVQESLRAEQQALQESVRALQDALRSSEETLRGDLTALAESSSQVGEAVAEQLASLTDNTARQAVAAEAMSSELAALTAADVHTSGAIAGALARLEAAETAVAELRHASHEALARWEMLHNDKADRRTAETGLQALSLRLDEIDALRARLQDGDPRVEQFLRQANELIVQQAQYIAALTHSRSWRITAPLRRAGDAARRLRAPVQQVRSRGKHTAIALLRQAVQATLRRPRLKRVARAMLARMPMVQRQLRVVLYRHDPNAPHMRPPQAPEPEPVPGAELPARTARIYRELKQAQQARKNN